MAVAGSASCDSAPAAIDVRWGNCEGQVSTLGNIESVVPSKLVDQSWTSVTMYFNVAADPPVYPKLTFTGSLIDPKSKGKSVIDIKEQTIDLCNDSPFLYFSDDQKKLGGLKFYPVRCPLAAGTHPIKFDVQLGDKDVSMNDYFAFIEGLPMTFFDFFIFDPQQQSERLTMMCMRRSFAPPEFSGNIWGPDDFTALEIAYCPPGSKSERCAAVSDLSSAETLADSASACKADHYRLTMEDAQLLLIAVNEKDEPLSHNPPLPEPRRFLCHNSGMFDTLEEKKNCLKIDKQQHLLVSNNNDDEAGFPCAEDTQQCWWGGEEVWTFHQAWLGGYQTWCMKDVDVSSCRHEFQQTDLIPTTDLTQCSKRWQVKRVFNDDLRKKTPSQSVASSCSDCKGNFQCFTKEKGCTAAATKEVCEALGSFADGKWASDGEWCPSSSGPSTHCQGLEPAVHFTCMGGTSCCGSGTLTPSCIDYAYNSCCEYNGIAIACAKGQKCDHLSGAPTCTTLSEFV